MSFLSITSSLKALNLTGLSHSITPSCAETYIEMTRRISTHEKDAIEKKTSLVSQSQIIDLLSALDQRNWQAPLFANENYPYIALAALQQGKISSHQFATILFFWVNFFEESIPAQVYPLFLETGAVDSQARQLIEQTLAIQPVIDLQFGVRTSLPPDTRFLTTQEIDAFFEEMRKLPLSEQCFFIKSTGNIPRIVQNIQNDSFNVFYQTRRGFMVPSMGIMQAFLNTKFKTQAMQLNPCMGLSTLDDMSAGQKNSIRDIAIHFPGIHLPEKAEGVSAPGYAFSYHDFYHAFCASCLNSKLRCVYLNLADELQKYDIQHPQKPLLRVFREIIIDLEFYHLEENLFRSLNPDVALNQLNFIFWNTLFVSLYRFRLRTEQDPSNVDLKKNDFLIPSEGQKKLIEVIIPLIPIHPEYREGCSVQVQSIFKQVEDHLLPVRQSLPPSAHEPYMRYHYPKEIKLRDCNIYAFIDRLWKVHLKTDQRQQEPQLHPF